MGTKYPGNTISGYNASPPSDDGVQVESNKVKWATHKDKLGDPLKALAEAMNTDLNTWADLGPITKSANYTTTAADHLKTIECTGTFNVTLGAAGTMGAGYTVTIKNVSTGVITVVGTIDGGTDIDINEDEGITVQVDAGAGSYLIVAGKMAFTEFTSTPTVSGNTIWHAGNDGAASTLDADLLDAQEGAYYLARANHTGTQTLATISDSGALAALNTVGQAQIDANAVGQSELKTTHIDATEGGSSFATKLLTTQTLAFFPILQNTNVSFDAEWGHVGNSGGNEKIMQSQGTGLSREIELRQTGGGSAVFRIYYVQASPTYDLGDGPCGLFVYLLLDKQGKVVSSYSAPEAPFHFSRFAKSKFCVNGRHYRYEQPLIAEMLYDGKDPDKELKKMVRNGNRDYVLKRLMLEKPEEMEITNPIKNIHMNDTPHPFIKDTRTDYTVAILDPVGDLAGDLFELHRQEMDISDLLTDHIIIGNDKLKRVTPDGCMVVKGKWR